MIKFNTILIATVLISLNLKATPLAEISAVIPIDSIRPEATDLYLNGKNLSPSEAKKLLSSGQDISLINPDETTDLWKNQVTAQSDDLGVRDGESFGFVEVLDTPLKSYRFVVSRNGQNGEKEMYQVFLGKRLQTYLLRRNLLRELGYIIPPMKYLKKLEVQFKSSIAKNDFVNNKSNGLKWGAIGDKEWITNLEDTESNILKMQDVVLMPAKAEINNLSLGVITPDFVLGRRLINALIIAYSLVDVRESVNGFRWYPGLRKSDSIYLPLEDAEEFSTTWSDARWILRRILKLERKQFEKIVSDIGYPIEAEKLIVEKIISRRNEMRRLFQLEGADLPFNPTVSHGEFLKLGELLKSEWPGFAPRLAMDEEPSIISGAEIRSLFKSKAISTAIQELMRRVNTDIIPRTDIQKIANEKLKKEFFDDFFEKVTTGKNPKRDLGLWAEPFYAGKIIASREVVAGSYLGTDNRVQLVDTFGFGIDAGLALGAVDLPKNTGFDGRAQVSYVRQYAHLRPLMSIDAALKEPYKNMIVPLLQRKWAQTITPELFQGWEELPLEEKMTRTRKVVEDLKEQLGDGESLIITDNIAGNLGIGIGYSFAERVKAQLEFNGQLVRLGRLHILRQGNFIHVYKDKGNIKSLQLVVSMRAGIEVLSVRASFLKAKARTDFYKVDLDTEQEPELLASKLVGIRDVLSDKSLSRIGQIEAPHRLSHQLGERQGEVNFLFWNFLKLHSTDWLQLQRPGDGEKEMYIRRLIGQRSGKDYQTPTVDLLNEILEELTDKPITVSNPRSGDPADTIFGKSKARFSVFEAELNEDQSQELEAYISINYRWRGWKSKRKQLEEIIESFSKRFNFKFFSDQALQQVKEAELFTLNLKISIFDAGIRHAMNMSGSNILSLLRTYWSKKNSTYLSDSLQAAKDLVKLQKKYQLARQEAKWDKAGESASRFLSLIEKKITHEGFRKAVGDQRNFLIQPIIMGFFRGEDGKLAEVPIEGNEIGQIGSDRPFGPMTSAQQEIGMSESEFFAYWILRRL